MNITLNGEPRRTEAKTIADLLVEQGFDGSIATAKNGDFVPKTQRADTAINEGDRIEVVAPMQGG